MHSTATRGHVVLKRPLSQVVKKDTRLETSIAHQSAEYDLDGEEVEVDDGECEAPGGRRAVSALSIALANIGKPARLSGVRG